MNCTASTAKQVRPPSRLEHLRDLLLVLTQKEIKVRYKNSWLGYVWSVAHPLAFALVYFIAFGLFLRVDIPNYTLFLITGLFAWHWLANSIASSPNIFLSNSTLLKKVRFPHHTLVAAMVFNDGFHYLVSVPVITAFLAVYGIAPSWVWLIGIPGLTVAQFLLTYGLALAIASINLFFRDLERLTSLLVMFLFFLTPIVYSEAMVPPAFRSVLYLNPFSPVILGWRHLFLSSHLDWTLLGVGYAHALVAVGLGMLVYRSLRWRFAEVV
ncbi:MAG TPA: ABC transporter permease [Gemmatimonadaceae bacterium]|nr:ABC transporter permease [Gemmatimonadaceae bacterium]